MPPVTCGLLNDLIEAIDVQSCRTLLPLDGREGTHLGVGRLDAVRPQLLRAGLRGQRAGGGRPAGAGAGAGRGAVRERAHARVQQLHAHHQLPADQLGVALQRSLRAVLVLRHIPCSSGAAMLPQNLSTSTYLQSLCGDGYGMEAEVRSRHLLK